MARFAPLWITAVLSGALPADAASPELALITPRGVQRGTEAVLSFHGNRLQDLEQVLFYEPGFEVLDLGKDASPVTARIRIAPDCVPGEHTAQIRTRSGISEYRTFFVGALPSVDEVEPNTQFDQPQPIEMNVTVHGVIENEDVDHFVVEAHQGQRLSVEIEGMRFGHTLFDPYVAILDSRRFELATADDTALLKQDAAAAIVVPEDGRYTIQVRESAYGGNGSCRYRLHVGTFPRPTAVYPAGGKIGEPVEVRFIGSPSGDLVRTVTAPPEIVDEYGLFAEDEGGIAPSSNPFRLYEHGNAFEQEPNNNIRQATPTELPLAFNGIIEKAADTDWFRFSAIKGTAWEVECYARRIRSGLDPVMNLHHAPDGRHIAGNDDSRGPDSYFRWTVPEDGEYLISVRDHLGRGNPDFVYRIEFQPVRPSLSLGIPRLTRYTQHRQQITVAKGNRFATLISANRLNFGGDLVLEGNGLPEGVTMIARPMPANMNVMPVVFEAAPDAALSGRLVDFTARHADENQNIRGGFRNRADFVIGPPGQSLFVWKDVERLPVAVIEELPFHIEIVQPKVPIVRDGSMNLKIVAHRKEEWDEQINVQFPFRPPGIGATSSVNIPKGQTECLYPISANGGAQTGEWPVYAIGSAEVNGTAWVASRMATLTVAEPWLGITLQRTAVEQGQETEIVGTIEVKRPFPGNATVELLGLPHKVTTTPLQIASDATEVIFPVKTEVDSPEGNHGNIFCRVTVTEQEEPIVHARLGGTELRIDKPLPPKHDEPPTPEPMPESAARPEPETRKPPERRLTRLEKLRLEAKNRGGSK